MGTTATRVAAALAALAVLVGACGDDDDGAVPATVTDGGTPTEAADAGGAIVPRVHCVDAEASLAFLTYTSEADVVVSVPAGPDNDVVVDAAADEFLGDLGAAPTVFAPGEHDGALFWVEIGGHTGEQPVTWTVRHAGEERSVSVTSGDGPACTASSFLDGPAPTVDVRPEIEHDETGRIVDAALVVELSGLPETSRCPAGEDWSPLMPEVRAFGFGADSTFEGELLDGASVRATIDDPYEERQGLDRPVVGSATVDVNFDITNVCVDADGTEHRSWAASPAHWELSHLPDERCFETIVVDDGPDEIVENDCDVFPALPLTDGLRIRIV